MSFISTRKFIILFLLIFTLSDCTDKTAEYHESRFPEADQQNIDGGLLEEAFNNAEMISDLQGLAVARNNVIVAEEYFNGAGPEPDSSLHIMSVTKSISSTLIGIALDKGFIQSVDQKLSEFIGPEVEIDNPELGKVTIHQLLMMTSGQDWHELGAVSEFNEFVSAEDQLKYILQKPILSQPGSVFNYSDGTAHLISYAISKATGMETSEFACKYLFEPMGIGNRYWYKDNRKIAYGGVGLCLGIHDMIKIGTLVLQDGFYNGEQIVSSSWISKATSFKINTKSIIPFLSDYGYFWWIGNSNNHNFICANGYAGQFILIVRELNLVIVSRSNFRGITTTKANENWYKILDIIINQILPAVKNN